MKDPLTPSESGSESKKDQRKVTGVIEIVLFHSVGICVEVPLL